MFVAKLLRVRFVAAIALALVLATAAYGFAASNVVPTTGAGDGHTTISGYTISNVTYALNATDPSTLDTVTFEVAPTSGASAPTHVQIQLVTNGTWYAASNTSGTTWSVDLTSANPTVSAASVNDLRVVAGQ